MVAHSLWERGVASSSLAIPTIFIAGASMKKYYLLWFLTLFCTVSFSLFSADTSSPMPDATRDDIAHTAQSWAANFTALTPASQELVANILYLSYRHAYLDEEATRALIELKTTLPMLRAHHRSSESPMVQSSAYLRATKRFFAFNGLRYYLYLTWQQCLDALESVNDPLLHEVIEQLQNNGTLIISDYIARQKITLPLLPRLQEHITRVIEQLRGTTHAVNALFDTITQHADTITDIDRLAMISNQIQHISDTLYEPFATIEYTQMNILSVSTHLFYTYYSTVYSLLKKENPRLLFGPTGMLTEKNQQQLPSPQTLQKFSKSVV